MATTYRLKDPTPDEVDDVYRIVEDRGDRVLVEDAGGRFAGWPIPPRWVIATTELERNDDERLG